MQPKSEIAAWLRLQLTTGVGNVSIRRLLAAFSLPQAIFTQDCSALAQVVSEKQARALCAVPEGFAQALEKLEAWLSQPGQTLITIADTVYPKSLLASPDPALLLYVQCADSAWWHSWAALEQAPLIAMVGSRKPTPQGLRSAKDWAQQLAESGYSVVSGLALGVDAAAHEGALLAPAWGSARSIAVVGTGLDLVYPKEHAHLAQRILDAGGAIISEYPLGTRALAANFPRRNRIIAGLSLGVVVLEAALQSGSLITARLAMEANREVFAVPGSIYAPQYQGCHALIKQGAQLTGGIADIFSALPQGLINATKNIAIKVDNTGENNKKSFKNTQQEPVAAEIALADLLDKMAYEPIGLDELVLALPQLDAAQLQVALLGLELSGRIVRLPGGRYQRLG